MEKIHTVEFVKRKAKKLKKSQEGLSHTAALDIVCRELGFGNYKSFLNSKGQ